MKQHFDAVIVGAGPAGWSAAMTLQEAGQNVLVVDQASFPRDKVCGGFLGAENQKILQEWGIWDELKRQGAKEITSVRLAASGGASVLWEKSGAQMPLVGLGVSRKVMDQSFRAAAERRGIVFQNSTCVEQSVRENEKWELQLMNRAHQTKSRVTTRHLIYSAGAPKIEKPNPKDLVGAYALIENAALPADEVGLYFSGGGHAGVNPFESGLTNVCYVTSRKKFEEMGRSLPRLFEYFKESNPLFLKAFGEARTATPWKAVTVPYRPAHRFFENGIFYTGDAAAVVHPVIGGGMTLAIDGGRLLGSLLANAAGRTDEQIAAAYQKTFLKFFSLRLQLSWWLGQASHNKAIADGVISTGSAGRKFLQTMFQFNHHSSTLSTGPVA